jgi:hypothetical protein
MRELGALLLLLLLLVLLLGVELPAEVVLFACFFDLP